MTKKIAEWELQLGNRIIKKYPNKFLGGIILAERGYGKSMYAYKTMAYVYYHLAKNEGNPISDTEAYKRALDSFIYTPDDFMDRIEYNIEHGIISPVWCLDDASVHFHSHLHLMNVYEYILLAGHFDTIRVVCTSLLITCPNKKRLFKPLREYDQ